MERDILAHVGRTTDAPPYLTLTLAPISKYSPPTPFPHAIYIPPSFTLPVSLSYATVFSFSRPGLPRLGVRALLSGPTYLDPWMGRYEGRPFFSNTTVSTSPTLPTYPPPRLASFPAHGWTAVDTVCYVRRDLPTGAHILWNLIGYFLHIVCSAVS